MVYNHLHMTVVWLRGTLLF